MPRCVTTSLLAAALVAGTALLAAQPASAQMKRNFPQRALRGTITFGAPPALQLNGVDTQLTPGARIHGTDNLLKMSGSLVGTRAVVDYTTEASGQVSEIWLLRDDEAAVQPWPRTPEQTAAWSFDPVAQVWTRP